VLSHLNTVYFLSEDQITGGYSHYRKRKTIIMWSVVLKICEGARKQKEKGGRIVKERIQNSHSSQGSRSRVQQYKESLESRRNNE
jgi:hypothetical protein